MIEFSAVTKLYGSVIGVNDISLSLADGAHGLLGPNGSGKTTLINLLVGRLRPTLGEVKLWGESPWGRQELLRQVGVCPAADVLYPNVTPLEWVAFLTELHGFGRAEAVRRAEAALDHVGLGQTMRRPLGACSKGMKQRAKLAQALAHDPRLLVLDEPFNGLDPVGRHEMAALLRQWAQPGRGLIVASHILYEVETLTPSFLLIRGGRLLASGSSQEIQSLLVGVPDQLLLRTNDPRALAALLCARAAPESLRIDSEAGTVTMTTREAQRLYRELPGWLAESGLEVSELASATDSLQSLFNTLIRRHRGEAA